MLVRTIHDLNPAPNARRVLVPTMGALHVGHQRLIERARELAGDGDLNGEVVVSVFVNPSQFNEPTDFERYPRDLDRDAEMAMEAGASWVYAPAVDEVYPPGARVEVGELPLVATQPGLEDSFRPGHFAGVVRVVRRLFELVEPDSACFGEKDWQQLAVVRAMSEQEGLGVRIEPVATVREASGLAMSSRNRLLTKAGLEQASAIGRGLRSARGASTPGEAQRAMEAALAEAGIEAEYAAVRDAWTLMPVEDHRRATAPVRGLVAAWVEGVRLIDNAEVCESPEPNED